MNKIKLQTGSKKEGTLREFEMSEHAYNLMSKADKANLQVVKPGKPDKGTDVPDEVKQKYEAAKANAKKLVEEKSYTEAIKMYEKAKELNPKSGVYCNKQIKALNKLIDEEAQAEE